MSSYLNELRKNPAALAVVGSLLGMKNITVDSLLQWTETSQDFTGATTGSTSKKPGLVPPFTPPALLPPKK
jgi:hypothetical protein